MTDTVKSEVGVPDAVSFRRNAGLLSLHSALARPETPKVVMAARPFAAFLARCGVAFIASFAVTWVYVAAFPMAFLARTYPDWIAKRTMLDQCALGTVAVFGDSRTVAAILPAAIAIPVTNFALSGVTPIETYFAVRRALGCAAAPKLVVIAHGALKYTGDSDYWNFGARSGFLSYAEMRGVERDADGLHDNSLQQLVHGDQLWPWLRDWLYSVRFPTLYFNSLVHGYVAGRWQYNVTAEQDILRSSGHALFGTARGSSDLAGEADARQFRVSPVIDTYFGRTLALLAGRHVPVLLVSMPINEATYRQSSPDFRNQFAAYLQMRAAGFNNVTISGPPVPCWPNDFYGDAWHFNAAGAAAYSREFGTLLTAVLTGASTVAPLPNHCPAILAAQSLLDAAPAMGGHI